MCGIIFLKISVALPFDDMASVLKWGRQTSSVPGSLPCCQGGLTCDKGGAGRVAGAEGSQGHSPERVLERGEGQTVRPQGGSRLEGAAPTWPPSTQKGEVAVGHSEKKGFGEL